MTDLLEPRTIQERLFGKTGGFLPQNPFLCTHQNPIFWNTGRGNPMLAALWQGGDRFLSPLYVLEAQVGTLLAERGLTENSLFASHLNDTFSWSPWEGSGCPLGTRSLAPHTMLCSSWRQAVPVWAGAAWLSNIDQLGGQPREPGEPHQERNPQLGCGLREDPWHTSTHPPKALGGDCSLLQFRGWHLLFWHLSFYLFYFLRPRYISPWQSWFCEANPVL